MKIAPLISRQHQRSLFWSLVVLAVIASAVLFTARTSARGTKPKAKPKPNVTAVLVDYLEGQPAQDSKRTKLLVTIEGTNFGSSPAAAITLQNVLNDSEATADIVEKTNTIIRGRVEVGLADGPASNYLVKLEINGNPIAMTAAESQVKVTRARSTATPSTAPIELPISYEISQHPDVPNLHRMVITGYSNRVGFDSDPNYMRVEIDPFGASEITILPGSNGKNMSVTFLAAEDFKVKEVRVTIYPRDARRGDNTVLAYSKKANARDKKTTASPPPNGGSGRGSGNGGSGGGPGESEMSATDETANTEAARMAHARGIALPNPGPVQSPSATPSPSPEADESDESSEEDSAKVQITKVDILSLQRRDGFGRLKIEGSGFGNYGAIAGVGEKELLCDKQNRTFYAEELSDNNFKRAQRCALCGDFPGFALPVDSSSNNNSSNGKQTTFTCPTPTTNQGGNNNTTTGASSDNSEDWVEKIQKSLHVDIVPRSPDFRVEKTKVLYANDKVIDVYFEFTHFNNFSEPFRLSTVTVTVTKGDDKESAHAGTATSSDAAKTYVASKSLADTDALLEYRYSILDEPDATRLFGAGVGKRFYAVQLSVVNHSSNKVIVPLSSIQAEIEWAYQPGTSNDFFDEGPATISPLSLPAVTGSFNAYQRKQGKQAKLFNFLDGLQTLAGAMVPVFGRSIERPSSIMAAGFIPGLRKALGDLSGEQLQRLTAMSWETVEEIPAKGSMEKFIYIQRSNETYANTTNPQIKRQIKSIAGMEVNGFEVTKSAPAIGSEKQ